MVDKGCALFGGDLGEQRVGCGDDGVDGDTLILDLEEVVFYSAFEDMSVDCRR